MSQTALARRAKLSREHLVRLEAGLYDPTVTTLTKLAKALGVPVTALLE
jgi:transcriptional regulator with XRE-family HTH domain